MNDFSLKHFSMRSMFFAAFSARVNLLSHSSALHYFNKMGKVFHPLVFSHHVNEKFIQNNLKISFYNKN